MLIKNNGSEATEVTCVNKVQNNSNACSCVAQLKIKNESVLCKLDVKEPHVLVQVNHSFYTAQRMGQISQIHMM